MEYLTLKQVKEGKGFISYSMREELEKLNLKEDDNIINFAYTDYGGDFFERVCIQYFSNKQYSNCFLVENTCYYGKNGVLFGQVAKDFKEASENYPLGFENIEELYFNMEYEAKINTIESIYAEYERENFDNIEGGKLTDIFKLHCTSFLLEKYSFSVLSSGDCDYCESDIFDLIEGFTNKEYTLIASQLREEKNDILYYGKIC